eukprot:CAMPEP_0206199606 /NCGR_PEP_ID=MMETSP0166-20121206/10365_1 /ASSEMBLY_ACC=CAM_ASM_000260 /TAXON_ID=95228 /ORGANISM="Vannella robusta, Strain DIVA3 518/3/11/1/6" /LENGTH=266 /DNA_ID=CAMNT_0053617747 /DNA_START=292 /DNA_END=1092 /DNA_ORIENTATION=-
MHSVPVGNGASIPMLWLDFPASTPKPSKHITIVYFHGGGFIEGSIKAYEGVVANLVNELQLIGNSVGGSLHYSVVIPEYRLAPENPLPTGIEDCLEAYKYILKEGNDENTILFMGDSAGGHLTISVALEAIEKGVPTPKALVAFSPWTDLTNSNPSITTNADNDPVLNPAMINKFSDWSAPSMEAKEKYSLLNYDARKFENVFPPLLIQVGSHEMLLDDAIFMSKLTGDLEIYENQGHDFNLFVGWIPEAEDALQSVNKFIKHHLL